jgi:uncharacterized protein YjbI with pentapeptide repeats
MQALIINSENFNTVDWEEDCFKYCEFSGLSPEGEHITSDFISCKFTDIDWYWGIFNIVNFVECHFKNCIFRGTDFASCKFVECTFDNCQFIKDNLNGDCEFNESVAYNCRFTNCDGFNVAIK